MFASSINNNTGIASVRKYLDELECKTRPTDSVVEALELCLSCNSSVFNNSNYLQTKDICLVHIQLWLIMAVISSVPQLGKSFVMTYLFPGNIELMHFLLFKIS